MWLFLMCGMSLGMRIRIVALSHHLVGCIHFLLEGCYRTKTKKKTVMSTKYSFGPFLAGGCFPKPIYLHLIQCSTLMLELGDCNSVR